MPGPSRCASHPSRPAVDACPVCGRPRCGVDARGPACPTCGGRAAHQDVGPRLTPLEQAVRAALAALLAGLLAGPVVAEYVESGFLQYVVPLVAGVLCGAAGLAAAQHSGRDRLGRTLRGLTCVYAVLGVAAGFALEGSQDPLTGSVGVAYALAVLGALGWTQPPRAPRGSALKGGADG